MKFSPRDAFNPTHCTYDILEATEELLAAIRRTSLGEKIVVEKHLRTLWEDANDQERWIIAAVSAMCRKTDPRKTRFGIGLGARVLEAVAMGPGRPAEITRRLDQPYTSQLAERVRDALRHLAHRGLVVRTVVGEYQIPEPLREKRHPWSERAVPPKRST